MNIKLVYTLYFHHNNETEKKTTGYYIDNCNNE